MTKTKQKNLIQNSKENFLLSCAIIMTEQWTRKKYDQCDLKEQDRISKGNGNYRLDIDQHPHANCVQPLGVGIEKDNIYNPSRVNHITRMINLESHLRNIDERDDRCSDKTMKEKNKRAKEIYGPAQKIVRGKCNTMLQSSYSRMEHPAMDLRSATINRFGFPIQNPQKEIFFGFKGTMQHGDTRFGIDSRADAKDSDPNEYMAKIDKFQCAI